MNTFTESLKTFWTEDEGMEMSEYALVGAIICLGCAVAFTALGTSISGAINDIVGVIDTRPA